MKVTVCIGSSCHIKGSRPVVEQLQDLIAKDNLSDKIELCGHCFVVCPQNAKEIVDETEKAKVLIQSGDPVVVSLAPSFVANYEGMGIEAMREPLKKMGKQIKVSYF